MHLVSFDDIVPEQPEGPRDRYILEEGDGDETYCRQVHDRGPDGTQHLNMIGPNFTEAEAGIILFALSAIARGDFLIAARATTSLKGHPEPSGVTQTVYQGPTEGVRA